MKLQSIARNLSKRGTILLVYGIIALATMGAVSAETYEYVQWFDTTNTLRVSIDGIFFRGYGNSSSPLQAIISATLHNPAGYGGLRLNNIYYSVFLNSTTELFSVRDSPEFFLRSTSNLTTIPARSTIRLTYLGQADSEVVNSSPFSNSSATLFLQKHNATDLTPIVGVDLVLVSSFGTLSVPFCFQMPEGRGTVCPPTRSPLPSRFR